ncbi:MAG TPA: DUF4185 domain-containing protein [Kofleriaceae bacterium]|nr:DUF4185 domain-containing protein [Kofleriaceae bacterium]
MMPARFYLALLFVLGCSTAEGSLEPDANGLSPDGGAATPDAPPPFTPALASSKQLCKLLSDRNVNDPSANDVQHRANVLGADLGIPVVASDKLYLLFGDTIGYAGIWPGTESHPDSVGYGLDSATAIAADPSLLCDRMRVVALPASQSIGPSVSSSVKADFAGAAMIAPSGHSLGEYIRNPAGSGSNTFPQLPGDFEVPSGAFSVNGSIYVFYTTVVGPGQVDMKASYLAKWVQPTTSGPFGYQVLYQVDERFDNNGAMHGNFINVAAEVVGDYLYVFGTGDYRRSKIHAARKPLTELEQPGGFEDLGEIVGAAGYGEISVHYYPSIGRWMLLAEESLPTSNHIVAYFSEKPEGPWGTPFVVHDMGDSAFQTKYCCSSEDNCLGVQMFNCNRTGFYGTYLMPTLIETASQVTFTYTMSSFSPYNVALFQTTFTK